MLKVELHVPMRKLYTVLFLVLAFASAVGQINTDQMLRVGKNALYFEDYMLSIQYFNRVIQTKPYLAEPYLFRAIAKLNLDDYNGAEQDASSAIERHPYLTDAWEVRGVARHNLGKSTLAIDDYSHALQLQPRNRQLLYNKSLAQVETKNYEAADSTFEELLTYYPNYDSGYLGRAQLNIERGDTASAITDIEKALDINSNAFNAYILRANIAIARGDSLQAAVGDMDKAIKLRPHVAGLYVNRAYLRYRLEDFFGAMADFDYALQIEPLNYTALFNRGLLLMELGDNDRALTDFDLVLTLDPTDLKARYNRSLINNYKGRYDAAIADINEVIAKYPELPDAYFIRSDIYAQKHDYKRSDADYQKARKLSRDLKPLEEQKIELSKDQETELAARRFATMSTIDDNVEMEEEFNNSAIRGRVQDRNLQIKPEEWIEVAYHIELTELRTSTYYIKAVDELNATRMLRFNIGVAPSVPNVSEAVAAEHFKSIEYYNSYLASHTPRAIDYLGRALDFMTLRDYSSAIRDIDRALALTPDLDIGYYLRAQAAYHNWQIVQQTPSENDEGKLDAFTRQSLNRKALDEITADLNRVVKLAPTMAEAWYNLAIVYLGSEDYTSALSALDRAISLKPEMGEAWYNRGYVYLRLGNEQQGIADLSRAGQLGVVPAYNLIKRISN